MRVDRQAAFDAGEEVFAARGDVQDGTAGQIDGGVFGTRKSLRVSTLPARAVCSRFAVCQTVSPSGMGQEWHGGGVSGRRGGGGLRRVGAGPVASR